MDAQKPRTLQEFANELAFRIEKSFAEDYGIEAVAEIQPVMKTNVKKTGITVHFEDSRVAPTVYADEAYQRYLDGDVSIPEIASTMCEKVYEGHKLAPAVPQLTAEEAKRHVTLTLVNTKKNQELLAKTPHLEVLGGELSAIPRWYLNDNASFVVNNDMCGQLGLTGDEVLAMGQQHINAQHFEAKSMHEIMAEVMGPDFMDLPAISGPPMIVLTSESRIQGSNALLSEDALTHVHDMIGDYCVIPSSIHEVICVPISDKMDPEEMRAMVREVNMRQVAPEERLSDQVFKHDGHRLTLVGESFKMEAPKVDTPKMDGPSVRMAM